MWSKRHTFGWIKIIHHECVLYLFSVWLSEGQVREVGSKKKSPKLIVPRLGVLRFVTQPYTESSVTPSHHQTSPFRAWSCNTSQLWLKVNCRLKVIFWSEKFSYNISQFTLFNFRQKVDWKRKLGRPSVNCLPSQANFVTTL